ncbi:ABC transporter substrate-binding protein [Isoptericola variabilis]|uniref:ABC-type transporter, periplasmic subunit family 3 n=1 Tax=Isoptericola variabilis (strain 225) TaxID=743718 RepID=F6FR80_ISOV2|nr:ABC transporter substrate-binding protein [Isoptericola variabilis]AEG42940.1 ABC-type transporter, periplasmic subunit family 3 [Isoptericola variabilis 225]TWH31810.1 polar amino acid transport system substrate-binding protein [Isoptericola variabilis J7]
MRLPALPVVSAAAAALLLAGCTSASQDLGSAGAAGSGSGAGSDEAATFDPSAVAVDEEVAALVPEAVAADGVLTVGSNLEYAPVDFVAADGTTPVGLDIDIVNALAATMGLEADVQSSTFDAIIPAVGSRYELGVSAFTITAERLETVNMVSYFTAGSQLAVAAGNPDGVDPENLCGVTVGVQTGTVQQDELEALTAACEESGAEPIEVLPYDSQADVTTNLAGGKLQAMYADSPIVGYAVEQTGGTIEALGEVRDAAPYGVVIAKDDTQLAEAVRAGLQKLMDDGTLAEIAEAWGSGEEVLTTAELNPSVG